MDHEIETDIAAGLSAGGFLAWRRKHALPPGTPCYNCATKLQGPWCHACGQLGEDYHRSAFHLIGETFESLTHADGRLWHTLPRLFLRPASLTNDYLAGKRAPQVPPLRLFLVVLLMVFISGELASGIGKVHFIDLHIDPGDQAHLNDLKVHVYAPWDDALTAWARTHLNRALAHPDRFIEAMAAWAHDFAFLMLPISAFLLALIFLFRRRFVLFDHLVFSMHSLSFQGLMFVTAMAFGGLNLPVGLPFILSPVHLFVHMRGVYGLGRFGTLVRMLVLFLAASTALGLIMLGLVVVGLASLRE